MKTRILGVFAITLLVLTISTSCMKKQETNIKKIPAIELSNMDTTVKPGVDFFQYVNGGWLAKNPIPATKSRYGAFDQLDEQNDKNLRELIGSLAEQKDLKKGTNEQRIGDFYSSGMDTLKIDKQGAKPLQPYLAMIDQIKTVDDIFKVAGQFQLMGISTFFSFDGAQDSKNSEKIIPWIYQAGLGLPLRDYYLEKAERYVSIRKEYFSHVSKMLGMLADKSINDKNSGTLILEMETKLAEASMSLLEQRDPIKTYNLMSQDDLDKISVNINWNAYYKSLGYSNKSSLNVAQPNFVANLNKMVKDYPIESWKTFMKWKLVNRTAAYLSKEFVEENFNFNGKILSGKKENEPRWRRVLKTTSSALGEAVGQVYVEKYFPPAAKERMLALVDNLRKAYAKRINAVVWMSPGTKAKAIEKLNVIHVKIGYPDVWRDYSKLSISRDNSYLDNVLNASSFETQRNLNKIGKPLDRNEWGMTPQTVNAYYDPGMNEIVFPAAILQPPFFNINADDAINYGAIGVVIGHEMTHGFDDQGRLYDKNGNLNDWWTNEDAVKYKKQTILLVDQYNGYKVIDDYHVNGELTLGENISDYGGLVISFEAYKMAVANQKNLEKLDGFTPEQRFFISFAQVWRQNIRKEELIRRVKEDVHSPGNFRVNGGVFNIPAFYEAFNISPSDPLYRKPELRPAIW